MYFWHNSGVYVGDQPKRSREHRDKTEDGLQNLWQRLLWWPHWWWQRLEEENLKKTEDETMTPPVNYSSDCNQVYCALAKLRMAFKIYDKDS